MFGCVRNAGAAERKSGQRLAFGPWSHGSMPEQFSLPGFAPPAPPRLTDRLFFAAFPDAQTAQRIGGLAQDRRVALGLKGRALSQERFHITLKHLGDYPALPSDIVAKAVDAGAAVAFAPFEVVFDRVASFQGRPNNRPFVMRGGEGLETLLAFQRVLGAAMIKAGLGKLAEGSFTPHVTLLYDDQLVAEQSIDTIGWTVREFVLIHSLIGQTRHVPLACWTLGD
jgi:2'-5' RNA ligase